MTNTIIALRGYDPITTGHATVGAWSDDLPEVLADKAASVTRHIAKVSDLHWSEFANLTRRVVWSVDMIDA